VKSLFEIYDKKNEKELIYLHKFILNFFEKELNKDIQDLSLLHKIISFKEINSLRLKLFQLINSKLNWENIILKICRKELINVLGPDILIQNKLNVSIQMPNDPSSLLELHSDCGSGDTPFQINLWIPITDAFDTNSMFVFNDNKTLNFINKKNKTGLKKSDFIDIKYGQILLFNPAVLHGNTKNKTNKTRISLNIRLKSLFSPDALNEQSDRKIGTYYKILNLHQNTKFSLYFSRSKFYE
tara:strand:- start:715 stop:1437 length:723 start_codon:yes stop_codon:yes gene_type:complete